MQERVAITGLGVISPIGVGREAFQNALTEQRSHFVEEQVAPGISRSVGRVGDLTPTSLRLQSSKASQIDVISRYAVEACAQALKDTRLELDEEARDRTGILLGTAFGCLESNALFDQYTRGDDNRLHGVSPLYFKSTVSNAAAGWASILLKVRGVNATFTSGNLAGTEAIGHAWDLISDGVTDLILAGGVDRVLPMNLLLDPPKDGIASEGAGILALESMSRAVARGAHVYGRLEGYSRMHLPTGDLVSLAQHSIESIGIKKQQLGAIVLPVCDADTIAKFEKDFSALTGISPTLWPLKDLLGEGYAAWSGLAAAAAALRLDQLPGRTTTVLILNVQPGSEGMGIAIRKV